MLTVCVQAQTPGSFTNVNALDVTSGSFLSQNTLNGGSFIDADGNCVLAKSKGSDDNKTNTAIVNGFEYENILNDTSGNGSTCRDAVVSNSNLVVWGPVNATCCSFEIALQVYDKNVFPNALLGGTAPPSISPDVSLTLNPNSTLGRIADVIHKVSFH